MLKSAILKPFLALAMALGVLVTAQAAEDTTKPDGALKATVDQLMTNLKANHASYRSDKAGFYKMVDEVVVPRFDAPFITQVVLGANYRTATADQRSRFTEAFKNMLVRAYADAMLDNYDSVKVDWQPVRLAPNADDTVVNTRLQRADGNQYKVSFRVHKVDADWKVYDISVEDISLVTSFKTQVNAEIKKSSLDAVIQKMEQGQLIKPKSDAKAAG